MKKVQSVFLVVEAPDEYLDRVHNLRPRLPNQIPTVTVEEGRQASALMAKALKLTPTRFTPGTDITEGLCVGLPNNSVVFCGLETLRRLSTLHAPNCFVEPGFIYHMMYERRKITYLSSSTIPLYHRMKPAP